jgi:hypothetical protein
MKPRYQFAEIPQDEEGKEFIRLARKFLNRDRYTMRVRGQHLKDGLDWRKHQFGSSIADSSHYRVYIEEHKRTPLAEERRIEADQELDSDTWRRFVRDWEMRSRG